MSRILIAGFGSVAWELTKILPENHYQITGLKRSRISDPSLTNQTKLTLIQANLNDFTSLEPISKMSFDYLIYCPSPDKRDKEHYRKVYIQGLQNLLKLKELILSLKRFIFISSTSVYSQNNGEWVDESSVTMPTHFSGQTILEAENLVTSFLKERSTVLRFGGIYGKKESRYIQQIKDGSIRIQSNTPRYINRIHVLDCAHSIKHLLELRSCQKLYLGVDDHPADEKEVVLWMASRLGMSVIQDPFTMDSTDISRTNNKRCRNTHLKKSGYQFLYSTYKEGYKVLCPH